MEWTILAEWFVIRESYLNFFLNVNHLFNSFQVERYGDLVLFWIKKEILRLDKNFFSPIQNRLIKLTLLFRYGEEIRNSFWDKFFQLWEWKFVIFFFLYSIFFLSSFLDSIWLWNLILARETNGFLRFHIFLCHAKIRGKKKGWKFIFNERNNSSLLLSRNKF